MVTLSAANTQWMTRPADERFGSLADLHAAALGYKTEAVRTKVPTKKIRVEAHNGDVFLMTRDDQKINLTNWSFGQLSQAADAPASYLQRLPAHMAADCIAHGLKTATERDNDMMFRREHSGMVTLRALTSDRYSRIWNSDITSRLVELESEGTWRPAPAAFDGSRGLYLGDRDMFAFMVDNDRRIFEKMPGGGLSRGFFIGNSEVGKSSFYISAFKYAYICGNHYVWGAQKIGEVRIRHVGNAAERAFTDELVADLIEYQNASANEDEQQIKRMTTHVIGKDLDAILDAVVKLKIPGLGKKMVTAGYELAQQREDWYGAPNTVWGLAGGLTEIARDLPNADERVTMEAAAGKLMEIAF